MNPHPRSQSVFRREALQATLKVLQEANSKHTTTLEQVLSLPALPKTPKHASPSRDDWLQISCDLEVAEDILETLIDAEAASIDETGQATVQTTEVASLVDLWGNYLESRRSNPIA